MRKSILYFELLNIRYSPIMYWGSVLLCILIHLGSRVERFKKKKKLNKLYGYFTSLQSLSRSNSRRDEVHFIVRCFFFFF